MQINRLDHVNVRTVQLDTMIDWYTNVLGMRKGERPNFPFPGAWIYAGDTAVVHLVHVDGPLDVGAESDLKLEHFAFSASGLDEFEAKLQAQGERYQRSSLPELNLVQINVWDPDGNHIHIDFRAEE